MHRAVRIGDVVEFKKVMTKYEWKIRNLAGRLKTDYIGEQGIVVSVGHVDDEPTGLLVDVLFNDGQRWCFEGQELEFIRAG